MSGSKLERLATWGQSIWLDFINGEIIENGTLRGMIDDGLRGLTSNPSIFNQAISQSKEYDNKIIHLNEKDMSTLSIYDELTTADICDAAEIFKPIYDQTNKLDGYVSLEINPELADDTVASISEGKRLFYKVNRPNLMIKVPATEAGFPVIEELLATGVNVNATLIFSKEQHMKTMQAFFNGLRRLLANGGDLSHIRSVASIFVSRTDTMIDNMISQKMKSMEGLAKEEILSLRGRAAVANCKIIYEQSKRFFSSDDFKKLAEKGASPQRVLWGSTSTKNPEYSDIKYISELMAKNTINTVPLNTLQAFLDHGQIDDALIGDVGEAERIFTALQECGIDMDKVFQDLLAAGIASFNKSFQELIQAIETKASQLCPKKSLNV